MALKTTGATTTYNVINRPALSETGNYYPVLKDISQLGAAMDDYLPLTNVGTIVLANSVNSFGFERRFSDLLDRYSMIDQEVTIYSGQTTLGDNAPIADVSQVWKGKIKNYRINVDSQELVISVESAPIGVRVVTKEVDAVVASNAGSRGVGQPLPIVFGTPIEVKGYLISAVASTAPSYAYATTLGTSSSGYINDGVVTYYVKDYDGVYRAAKSGTVGTGINGLGTGAVSATHRAATTEDCWRTGFASVSTDNYLATGINWQFRGTGVAGTVTGSVTFKVYEDDGNGRPAQNPIATSVVDKASYSAQYQAAALFTITGSFDKPFLFNKSTYYYVSFSGENEVLAACSESLFEEWGGGAVTLYQRNGSIAATAGNVWATYGTLYPKPTFSFYPCNFADTPDPSSGLVSSNTGLGYSYFTVTQNTAGTGQTNPDLTKLDWVVGIGGMKDNSSGTISGSAGYRIIDALNACKLLDKEWNGSSWTGGRIDSTKFSSYQLGASNTGVAYERDLFGATTGRVTLTEILRDICRCSASRLATVNSTTSGKYLGFWAHGQTVATSAVITDEEAKIISIDQRGVESIVNHIQGGIGRSLTSVDPNRWVLSGGAPDSTGIIYIYNGSPGAGATLCSLSTTTYGQRYLANAQFNFIGEVGSAATLAAAIVQKYAFPTVFVEIEVPFFKYSTLSLLDVVEVFHPDLPAYFGTSSDAHSPTYTGTEVDMRDNLYWKRAQRYRAQIESRTIDFNLGDFPTLTLVVRLLLNSPNDPT